MKISHSLTHIRLSLVIPLLTGLLGIYSANVHAVEQSPSSRQFATPDAAVNALKVAVQAKDQGALREIFGPEYPELLTGDKVQDANNVQRFATEMAQRCQLVQDGDDKITVEVGANQWPMPIPLVKVNGRWSFDTAAGKEEIINRHIGKDELHAIGVCRAYVIAQRRYADENPEGGVGLKYAQFLKSTPGKKDGLYWPATSNEPMSPFGTLVAEAQAEGYVVHARGTGPHPFHGYYFRILRSQGAAAPGGKMNYLNHGVMTGGFALVAYPEHWNQSGIMTFIVGQDGRVFQQDLGEKTSELAGSMKEYNPDDNWTLVKDEGIPREAFLSSKR